MTHKTLEHAPTHIKLAVDLIMLLEQHQVAPETVLKALEIVEQDYKNKLGAHTNVNLGSTV